MGCSLLVLTALAAGAAFAPAATAAPTPITFVLNGTHPAGRLHEGAFTSGPPFCPAGSFRDERLTARHAYRRFTCADGSGTILVVVHQSEGEERDGRSATWRVSFGTGSYETFVGTGRWVVDVLQAHDPGPFRYTATWKGLADLDARAPTVAVARAQARRTNVTTVTVQLAFRARDNVRTNTVAWTLRASAGGFSVARRGRVRAAAHASVVVRLPVTAGAKHVLVRITAADRWGNRRTVTRRITVRS